MISKNWCKNILWCEIRKWCRVVGIFAKEFIGTKPIISTTVFQSSLSTDGSVWNLKGLIKINSNYELLLRFPNKKIQLGYQNNLRVNKIPWNMLLTSHILTKMLVRDINLLREHHYNCLWYRNRIRNTASKVDSLPTLIPAWNLPSALKQLWCYLEIIILIKRSRNKWKS